MRKTSRNAPNLRDRARRRYRPRQGRSSAKGNKGVGPPSPPSHEGAAKGRPVAPRMESDLHDVSRSWRWKALRSTARCLPFAGQVFEVGLARDPPKGGLRRGWCESDGHPNARTHVSVTTECSGRVEPGLSLSSLLHSKERATPRTRCPRPALARKGGAPLAASDAKAPGRERVWLRPAHARGTKLSRGESALRVVLQKSNDDAALKEARIAKVMRVNGS